MINEKEFEEFVFLHALENAISFNGKCNPKALIGRCIPKFPKIKEDMQHFMNEIENICEQVNGMKLEEQKLKLIKLNPNFFEKKTEKKEKKQQDGLPELEGLEKGKVVTRFSPAPSGYLHLGGLMTVVYNYLYVKKFGGKFILRLEDTNPEKIDIANYDKLIDDIKWITDNEVDEIYYQSDRMEIYYKYLRQLIETGKAYVCECEPEVFKAFNDSSSACPHRAIGVERQKEMYEKFFDGTYKEGDASVRFKANLEDKNPALRDFPIARIKEGEHARVGKKYKFWPMYNLCAAIDDSLMKITHTIRGKDHEINGIRQDMIKDALNLKKCNYYHMGRLQFVDIEMSKSKLTLKIKAGEYSGWDDPRVPTIVAYRKKGYKAEAFRNFFMASGLSKRDSKISSAEFHKSLNYFNKQILEKEANRYFFVSNTKTVQITNPKDYPDKKIQLLKHPDFKEKGVREFKVEEKYFIDGNDFKRLEKGDIFRLMHFGNFKVSKKDKEQIEVEFVSKEYDKNLKLKSNIHFVPVSENEKIKVYLDDNSILEGVCEKLDNIKVNDSLQFERFGFVRFDNKDKGLKEFCFTHR